MSETVSMKRPRSTSKRRLSVAIALSAALVGGLLSLGAAPASATKSVVCTGYAQCAAKNKSNHGYNAASDNLYWRMFGGHNCTNYVAYRLVSAGMPNVRPWEGGADARYWGGSNESITDKTPVKGAVAWWDSNKNGAGSSGHVAYVEKVISSTEILISEDNWQGNFFYKRITKSGVGWPTGFIHFKDSRTPAAPLYSATKVSQTYWADSTRQVAVIPSAMKPGSSAVVEVRYRNTGRHSWTGVQLGTQSPADHATELALDWKSPGRATSQRESVVKPGKVATFRFKIKVPADAAEATRWVERLAPVATSSSGKATWMTQSLVSLVVEADTRQVFTATPRPVVSGTAREGAVLTASAGTWAPASATLSYQWKRAGVAISGARSATYTLTDADVGLAISVTVAGAKSGYTPSAQTSGSTGIVRSLTSNTLRAGTNLKTGMDIVSKNGRYRFVQLDEGDARIYDRLSGIPLWSTATYGNYLHTTLSSTGSLVTRNSKDVKWSSATSGRKVAKAVLRDDGTLVLQTASGKVRWSSKTSHR